MNDKTPAIPPSVSPDFSRKLLFPHFQLAGIGLLLLIPVLALLGAFGQGSRKTGEMAPGLEMLVEYSPRLRYMAISALEVSLKNTSAEPMPALTVVFDHAYISAFSNVWFTPSVKEVTGTGYRVQLNDIRPGETRRVSVSLQAKHYGLHEGGIRASMENNPVVRIPVSTFIFP